MMFYVCMFKVQTVCIMAVAPPEILLRGGHVKAPENPGVTLLKSKPRSKFQVGRPPLGGDPECRCSDAAECISGLGVDVWPQHQ